MQAAVPEAGPPAAPETGPAAALRVYFGDKLTGRTTDLAGFREVVVKARASRPVGGRVVLATPDAAAYEAPVALTPELREVHIPLANFRPGALCCWCRAHTRGFCRWNSEASTRSRLHLADTEVLQLLIDPAPAGRAPLHIDVEAVWLR